MTAPDQVKKSPSSTILVTLIALLLLIGLGTTSYLFYRQKKDNSSLRAENSTLSQQVSELTDQNTQLTDDLATEKSDASKTKQELEEDISTANSKIDKVKAYNALNEYIMSVVRNHGGLINLTQSEYEKALAKAKKTGDSKVISATKAAWNNTSLTPAYRLVNLADSIINGIEKAVH